MVPSPAEGNCTGGAPALRSAILKPACRYGWVARNGPRAPGPATGKLPGGRSLAPPGRVRLLSRCEGGTCKRVREGARQRADGCATGAGRVRDGCATARPFRPRAPWYTAAVRVSDAAPRRSSAPWIILWEPHQKSILRLVHGHLIR